MIGFFQSLLFCGSALLLTMQVERTFQKDLTGLLIILFLLPEIQLYNDYMITESLTSSFIMLSFSMALKIYNGNAGLSNMFLLSLILGFTAMNRLESIVITFPILYLIYPRIKDELASGLTVLFSIPVLLLQLNGYRNYKTFHTYKLSAFNGGEVIYGGNNENLDGSHHPFWQHKEIFIPKNKIKGLNDILSQPECISCPKRDSYI